MTTTFDKEAIIKQNRERIEFCNKKIEVLTHSELYGRCLAKCNTIVINKERMMVVKVGKSNMTDYEYAPIAPTFFTKELAQEIINNDIYRDYQGNRIPLEAIGELEYYKLLKEQNEKSIEVLNMTFK